MFTQANVAFFTLHSRVFESSQLLSMQQTSRQALIGRIFGVYANRTWFAGVGMLAAAHSPLFAFAVHIRHSSPLLFYIVLLSAHAI